MHGQHNIKIFVSVIANNGQKFKDFSTTPYFIEITNRWNCMQWILFLCL